MVQLGASRQGDVLTVTTPHGLLHINAADGSYLYQLTSPITSPAGLAGQGHETVPGVENFVLRGQDANGNRGEFTLTVDVVDDMPLLAFDHNGTGSLSSALDSASGYACGGSLHLSYGADLAKGDSDGSGDALVVSFDFQKSSLDGGATVPSSSTGTRSVDVVFDQNGKAVITTELGLLTLTKSVGADGKSLITYSYEAKTGHAGDFENFTFTVTDNDGDAAKVDLNVSVNETIVLNINGLDSLVYEGGIDGSGSQVMEGANAANWDYSNGQGFNSPWTSLGLPPGVGVDGDYLQTQYGAVLQGGIYEIKTAHGVLYVNAGDGSYLYRLTSPVTSSPAEAGQGHETVDGDSFVLRGKDQYGNCGEFSLDVSVVDDIPVFSINGDGQDGESTLLGQTGSFYTDGKLFLTYGADGAAESGDALVIQFHYQKSILYAGETEPTPTQGTRSVTVNFAGGKAEIDTELGLLTLTQITDPNGQAYIQYEYLAKTGHKGDFEQFLFTATDKDGDEAAVALDVTLDQPVPAGTTMVDEAGIPGIGSNHAGHGGHEESFSVILPDHTIGIEWTEATLPALRADIDGSGTYLDVVWLQENGVLHGKAGGVTVITVTPDIANGTFTATLEKPVQHSEPGQTDNSSKGLFLEFTAQTGDGTGIQSAVSVAVRDDVPLAVTDYVSVAAAQAASYNVYMVLDLSGSMWETVAGTSTTRYTQAVQALQALVRSYAEIGDNVRFTLLTFSDTVALKSVTTSLADITRDLQRLLTSPKGGGTNYYNTLAALQERMEGDMSDPALNSMEQKVYFISDGAPAQIPASSWQDFADRQGVDVVSVGIDVAGDNNAQNALQQVANSGSGVINVTLGSGVNALTDALLSTIPSEASGNFFGNDQGSADVTVLEFISVNGIDIPADGSPVDLGDGVIIKVWPNGDYSIVSNADVSETLIKEITYTLKDADGDSSTGKVILEIRDGAPEVFDNIASLQHEAAGRMIMLDNFNANTSLSAWNCVGAKSIAGLPTTYTGAHQIINELDDPLSYSKSAAKGILVKAGNNTLALRTLLDGIEPELLQLQNGMAYNPTLGCSAMTKNFSFASEGEIAFSWAMHIGAKGNNVSLGGSLLCILRDELGNIVHSEMIYEGTRGGSDYLAGLTRIPVSEAGRYTLSLVMLNYDPVPELSNFVNYYDIPSLWVDTLTFTPTVSYYGGNAILDEGPEGLTDVMADAARLLSFNYNGTDYVFGEGVTSITTDDGMFTMDIQGNYKFFSDDPGLEAIRVEYTVIDRNGDTDSASIYIVGEDRVFNAVPAEQQIDTAPDMGCFTLLDPMQALWTGGTLVRGELDIPGMEPGIGDLLAVHSSMLVGARSIQPAIINDKLADVPYQQWMPAEGALRYNSYAGLMEKSFTFGGETELLIPWQFSTPWLNAANAQFKSGYDRSLALWVLRDAQGNIVDSGLVHAPDGSVGKASGVLGIRVPEGGTYTLQFAVVGLNESGRSTYVANAADALGYPALIIGDIYQAADFTWRASGDVIQDVVYPENLDAGSARLVSVVYGGVAYDFSLGAELVLANGALIINESGAFRYDSSILSPADAGFAYTVEDGMGGSLTAEMKVGEDGAHGVTINQAIETWGSDGADVLVGSDSADILHGGEGDDVLYGGKGDDTLYGGDGHDRLHGGEGDDVLYGGEGNDALYGDAGDDVLYGGAGNDTLYGGAGNDILVGGLGDDVLFGGTGADTFVWESGELEPGGRDVIMDFSLSEGDCIRIDDIQADNLGELLASVQASVTDTHLELRAEGQTIEVHMKDAFIAGRNAYDSYQDFVTDYNNNTGDQEVMMSDLLRQIFNITG